MKLGWATAAVVLLIGILAQPAASAYPAWQGTFFNDYVGAVSPSEAALFEDDLRQFERNTTVEIAVAIVNDTGGEDLELYALHLFEHWGLGKRDLHNGLLFLMVTGTREVRIEVGYGLESLVNSYQAHRIIEEEILPRVRDGDVAYGLAEGVLAAEGLILQDPEYAARYAAPAPEPPVATGTLLLYHFAALVLAAMVVLYLGRIGARIGLTAQACTVAVAVYYAFAAAPWWFPLAVLGLVPLSYVAVYFLNLLPLVWGGRGGGGFGTGGGRSGGGGGSGRW